MFVLVSPGGSARARVAIREVQDLSELHVEFRGVSDEAGSKALANAGLGEADGEVAWLMVTALRSAAGGGTGSDWTRRFDAMLTYAQRSGWTDAKLSRVRAHVVRT